MPTWPQLIPLASLALKAFRQFLVLASPPSIPLSAYVYAVLGVPPTQTGTMMLDLLHSYTQAFNSDCEYGSTVMTVNATVYAGTTDFSSGRNAQGKSAELIDMGQWCLKLHYSHRV